MNDKEKAEFINETTEKICDWCASEKTKIEQAIKEGLEKGLAEGRKEKELSYEVEEVTKVELNKCNTIEDKME